MYYKYFKLKIFIKLYTNIMHVCQYKKEKNIHKEKHKMLLYISVKFNLFRHLFLSVIYRVSLKERLIPEEMKWVLY